MTRMDDLEETLPEDGAEPASQPHGAASRRFSPRMLEALVCPVTGVALSYDATRSELVSRAANLAFPIRSGIPIMLVDEARRLEDS